MAAAADVVVGSNIELAAFGVFAGDGQKREKTETAGNIMEAVNRSVMVMDNVDVVLVIGHMEGPALTSMNVRATPVAAMVSV